jgi:hypothetical protein
MFRIFDTVGHHTYIHTAIKRGMGGHKQELWEKWQDISWKGILEGTWGWGYMEIKERINGGKMGENRYAGYKRSIIVICLYS